MTYILKGSKELEINKDKKPKILVQRWGNKKEVEKYPGDCGIYLNILEWNEENGCFESKYNLNIIDQDPLSEDTWSFEYCDNRRDF